MESTEPHFKRFVFILIDGAPYETFKALIENGDLPNIKKHVVDRGSLNKAISTFTSTTGPAFIPFFMGLYPGTANVPGLRWLSKSNFQLPNRFKRPGICSYMGFEGLHFATDLPEGFPTLFDFFSPASNIYNPITRGCPPTKNLTRWIKPLLYTYGHFSYRWRFVNQIAERYLHRAAEAGDQFIMCLFPAVDAFSHHFSMQASEVLRTYREIDAAIGKLVHILQKANTLEETLILITSDHGMTDTHTHIDIPRHLDDGGWRCLHYPKIWRQGAVSASMVSGNGMTHLYFKNSSAENGWGERTPFEKLYQMGVIGSLIELEGLGLVAGQSETGAIIVQSRTGQGKISCHSLETVHGNLQREHTASKCADALRFSYQFAGTDPLGYGVHYKNLSSREALRKTYDSSYPDGIVQLWQIFNAERTGDLVLSAESGYDLRARYEIPKHHATHGALIAEHMHIPLAMNYPIAEQSIRSVDVFPTVLNLCGHNISEQYIDGRIVR
ncbi:alkaline phosphatase family protein [Candidatus Poribacteria bacterium]|nr:alkaline phosphatase family protein [Candidatus Poribacteria bacterium]MYH82207.1 alkaline phosphatase family protein [Candidatus Poribacteria bacterium]MYK96871.1 alkaline phosphatase family protein [Candidatus Poribacteria bacterium]